MFKFILGLFKKPKPIEKDPHVVPVIEPIKEDVRPADTVIIAKTEKSKPKSKRNTKKK